MKSFDNCELIVNNELDGHSICLQNPIMCKDIVLCGDSVMN